MSMKIKSDLKYQDINRLTLNSKDKIKNLEEEFLNFKVKLPCWVNNIKELQLTSEQKHSNIDFCLNSMKIIKDPNSHSFRPTIKLCIRTIPWSPINMK